MPQEYNILLLSTIEILTTFARLCLPVKDASQEHWDKHKKKVLDCIWNIAKCSLENTNKHEHYGSSAYSYSHASLYACSFKRCKKISQFVAFWEEKKKIQQSFLVYKQMNCNLKLNNNDLTYVVTVDHTGDEENFIQESQILASESLAWYSTSSICVETRKQPFGTESTKHKFMDLNSEAVI